MQQSLRGSKKIKESYQKRLISRFDSCFFFDNVGSTSSINIWTESSENVEEHFPEKSFFWKLASKILKVDFSDKYYYYWYISSSKLQFTRNCMLSFFQQGFSRRLHNCPGRLFWKISVFQLCINKLRLQKIQNCHQIRCLSMFNFIHCKKLPCFLPPRYQSKFFFQRRTLWNNFFDVVFLPKTWFFRKTKNICNSEL